MARAQLLAVAVALVAGFQIGLGAQSGTTAASSEEPTRSKIDVSRLGHAFGALAIGFLTLGTPVPLSSQTAQAAGPFACPATAKPANLNFTLKDLNGNDVRLAAYKGQVILLDFWATWCGPCKIEVPWFVDLQTRYGKQGLQVLGVSVDDTIEKLKPYAAQFKMNYPVLQGLGRDEVLNAFGPMDGLPTTFVISREGRICETHTGLSSKSVFETQIKSLLAGRR